MEEIWFWMNQRTFNKLQKLWEKKIKWSLHQNIWSFYEEKKEFSDFSVFGVGFQIEIDLFEAQNKNLWLMKVESAFARGVLYYVS